MKAVVVILLGLGSALAREPGAAIRDRASWQAETSSAAVLPRVADEDEASGDLASVLAPEIGVAQGDLPNVDDASDAAVSGGQWEIACEIKSGSALVFDRASLREYGPVTLFRWSAPRTR